MSIAIAVNTNKCIIKIEKIVNKRILEIEANSFTSIQYAIYAYIVRWVVPHTITIIKFHNSNCGRRKKAIIC